MRTSGQNATCAAISTAVLCLGFELSAPAQLAIDQQWANEGAAKTATGNLPFTQGRGQTFVPDQDPFSGIEFLANNPGGAKTATIEFVFGSGVFPPDFASPTATFAGVPIPAGDNWIRLVLPSPIPVTAGGAQLYSFGLRDFSGNLLSFFDSDADAYTNPCCGVHNFSGLFFNGGSWLTIGGNRDIAFRTLAGVPEVSFDSITITNAPAMQFGSASGTVYGLEFTLSLAPPTNWVPTGATIEGNGSPLILYDPTGSDTNKTYRIVVN